MMKCLGMFFAGTNVSSSGSTYTTGQCTTVFGRGLHVPLFPTQLSLFAGFSPWMHLPTLDHFAELAHRSSSVMNHSIKQVQVPAREGCFPAQELLLIGLQTPR